MLQVKESSADCIDRMFFVTLAFFSCLNICFFFPDLSSQLVAQLLVRDHLRTKQDAMLLDVQDMTSLWQRNKLDWTPTQTVYFLWRVFISHSYIAGQFWLCFSRFSPCDKIEAFHILLRKRTKSSSEQFPVCFKGSFEWA